jgi:hypothetical protein
MSRINQRLVAEDGVQIHASTRNTSLPDPDSLLLYQHEDRLACHSQNNATPRFVVEETPPILTNSDLYQCTRNDTIVMVDSTNRSEVDIMLPHDAYVGKKITIVDAAAKSLTNPIRVAAINNLPVQNDSDVLMLTNGISLTFLFTGSEWKIV